ncbi:MAG TPA: Flp family type IVb pilin [Rhizomicrobium sp.]|jgi:pilus assembly protein Flp/PilA
MRALPFFNSIQAISYTALLITVPRGLMKSLFAAFLSDESGVTAIEYGLIAALIGIVIISALANDGLHLSSTFSKIATSL